MMEGTLGPLLEEYTLYPLGVAMDREGRVLRLEGRGVWLYPRQVAVETLLLQRVKGVEGKDKKSCMSKK